MTPEEKRAYARGYNAASQRRWREHLPPLPPDSPLVAEIMAAAMALRNAIDAELAKFAKDDPMAESIYPHVDRLDAAMRAITDMLRAPPA